jgi:hypothetical protein
MFRNDRPPPQPSPTRAEGEGKRDGPVTSGKINSIDICGNFLNTHAIGLARSAATLLADGALTRVEIASTRNLVFELK